MFLERDQSLIFIKLSVVSKVRLTVFQIDTINTSYFTDSYIVFTLRVESVYKVTIFAKKNTEKICLEVIFLKFFHAEATFF